MKLFEKSCFMRQIEETAKGKPLILHGAGMDAVWAIEDWRRNFGLTFQGCVCDGDSRKQGGNLDGVEILSPDLALERYPDAPIWVAAKDYKFEIMGDLVYGRKVPETRILNYEPLVRKRGCRYAEKVFFSYEKFGEGGALTRQLRVCFESVRPVPQMPFGRYEQLADQFSQFRDEVVDMLVSDVCHPKCKSCDCIKDSYYAADRKIRTYNLATDGRCNFKCRYCHAPIFSNERVPEIFDFMKALEIIAESGMLADDLHMDITSGEICVNPYRSKMLDAAVRFAETVSIATNASIFDQQMFELLQSRRASLIVSVDAGTRETFKNVKRRDQFDKVKGNLIAYGKAGIGAVELKYIILPGVNDKLADVEGFVDLCQEVNPAVVTISFDFYYEGKVSPHTIDMINQLKNKLSMHGFFYKYEARAAHFLRQSDEVQL